MKKYRLHFALSLLIFTAACSKDSSQKQCPKGFTGINCDEEITPSKIQTTYIEAVKLPPFDGSSNWDILGGKPDIYFKLLEESSGTVIFQSGIAEDANPALPVYTDLAGSSVLFNFPAGRYTIEAWDHDDLDADDYMGGISFRPYIKGQKFPLSVKLDCSGCNTSWNMKLIYLF